MKLLIVLMVAALLCGGAAAQDTPDFSGEWTMNAAESDFGQFPAPSSFVRKIEHNDPELKYTTIQSGQAGTTTSELSYTTDGTEQVNDIRGARTSGSARWDGDVLEIRSTRGGGATEIRMVERWTLSDDGKALRVDGTVETVAGSQKLLIVLER